MNARPRQLNLFLLALGFLTRIPPPTQLDYSPQALSASARYFTLVGAVVGLCMAATYLLLSPMLPPSVTILLVLIANLLLTGCFHQDGLADMADGFGGAFQVQRKLEIMKDSRLGTYGNCALLATLALQYSLLLELESVVTALLIAQSVSRCVAASIIYDTPYAADPEASKTKPLATAMSGIDLAILLASAALFLLLLPLAVSFSIAVVLVLLRHLFRRYVCAQIGGYTGDCLGAAQQLSESSIYIVLLIWQGLAA